MKSTILAAVLLLSVSFASAATTQKWTPGWGNFNEPLNYTKSNVKWSVSPTKSTLSVTFTLVDATPSKLYQVGVAFFCTTFPATFGQFPTITNTGNCEVGTAQGVTKTIAGVYVGVVTTDIHGNGSFTVIIGPIASGTYDLEFLALDGVRPDGCTGNGGADFQSPGPTYGDTTTITIP